MKKKKKKFRHKFVSVTPSPRPKSKIDMENGLRTGTCFSSLNWKDCYSRLSTPTIDDEFHAPSSLLLETESGRGPSPIYDSRSLVDDNVVTR